MFNTRYQTAKTTAFITQPFGGKEYDLFHFEMLDDGEAGNAKVKVSISNLRRSTNPKYEYGTFTVLIRDFSDTDTDMKVLVVAEHNDGSINPSTSKTLSCVADLTSLRADLLVMGTNSVLEESAVG